MSSARIGQVVPGVLTTGLQDPQMVYKGDDIVDPDAIYAHVEIPPQSQSVKAKIYRNGSAMQKDSADAEIEITAGSSEGEVTGLDSVTIVDSDVFQVYITQVGIEPNEGAWLMWLVVP